MRHVIGRFLRGIVAAGASLVILAVFAACSLDTGSTITESDTSDQNTDPTRSVEGELPDRR